MGGFAVPTRGVDGKEIQRLEAIASNVTNDGKILYTKIHGQKVTVAAGASHTFRFVVSYTGGVYFQGAEIMQDINGVSDFHVSAPDGQGGYVSIEQYGYDVNIGTLKYVRESRYAANIPYGVALDCVYTNDTTESQEVGCNFLMHEIREPA